MVVDLGEGSWFDYQPGWLAPARADALLATLDAWSDTSSDYDTRVAAVEAAIVNAFDDGDVDLLTGASGRDLFYAGISDILTDVHLDESVV